MRLPLSPAQIAQARAVDMVDLVKKYGVELTKPSKSASELVGPCPACGTGHDRFRIKPEDKVFHCRVCGRGGRGAIDLLLFITGGDPRQDFADAVRQLIGEDDLTGEVRARSAEDIERERQGKQRAADNEAKRKQASSSRIWHGVALPPVGTIVETYLRARGFRGVIPPTIRFLPACARYPVPKMVAAFAMPYGKPGEFLPPHDVRSLHLTELRDDGSDRLRHDEAKRATARHVGVPVAVSAIGADGVLYVCEGIESALSWAHQGGAWAAGSAPHLPGLAKIIPDYVRHLFIEQHDDDDGRKYTARLIQEIRQLEQQRDARAGGPITIQIVRECAP